MKNSFYKISLNFKTTILIIAAVTICRILPHPWNLAPLGAIALFGGAVFKNNFYAFTIPLSALFVSDLFLNNFVYNQMFNNQFTLFYQGAFFDYLSFGIIIFIGKFISNKISPLNIVLSSISGAVLFFVVSNFGVWISTTLYAKSLSGLLTCYAAGIPFFPATLVSDIFFSTLLFGLFSRQMKSNDIKIIA
jgi:hypothetical protein